MIESDVAVLTSTMIPERTAMLGELMESVAAQTHPCRHLIEVDVRREGCNPVLNRLARHAFAEGAEWLCAISDDDLFYPYHVERLLEHAADADVIYSLADVSSWPAEHGAHLINRPFDASTFRQHNTIPGGAALIRAGVYLRCGGFGSDRHAGDHQLWRRILDAGGTFVRVEEETWVYRYHGANLQEEVHG